MRCMMTILPAMKGQHEEDEQSESLIQKRSNFNICTKNWTIQREISVKTFLPGFGNEKLCHNSAIAWWIAEHFRVILEA